MRQHHANKYRSILEDRKVSISQRVRYWDFVVSSAACVQIVFFCVFFFVPLVTAECPVCLTVFFYWSISRHRARWPPDVHRRGPSLGWELAVVEGGWRLQRRSHKLKNDLLGHRLDTSVWSTVNTTVFFFFPRTYGQVRAGQGRSGLRAMLAGPERRMYPNILQKIFHKYATQR